MFDTASSRLIVGDSFVRDSFVEVVFSGTHTTMSATVAIGTRIARSAAATVRPPSAEAAALSGWPSSSAATRNAESRASKEFAATTPSRWAMASSAPPTRAAPLKPSPRPIGIRSCDQIAPVPPAAAKATLAGCRSSHVRALFGVFASASPASNRIDSARPRVSKPAPRFAVLAGTETRVTNSA